MDKLSLLRGKPYIITPYLKVANPTVGEICGYSEEKYWNTVSKLTGTAYDYRLFLDDQGIDYVNVGDYEMFLMLAPSFTRDETEIILPGINFQDLEPYINTETEEVALKDKEGHNIFDRYTYLEMVDYIRTCHGFKRNWLVPGNKLARKYLMEDERERRKKESGKPFNSMLESLVSALCNHPGFKYSYHEVWDLPIYTFLDAVRRIQKIDRADHLANGLYAGNLDTKKMNKTQLNKDLNWMGEL